MRIILANPDLVEGGEFYKVSGPVLHKLPKGTGDWKPGAKAAHPEGAKTVPSGEGAKAVPSSTGVYPSGIPLPYAIKPYAINLSTPGKPGAEAPAFGEGKGSVSGVVFPKPIPKPISDSDSETDSKCAPKHDGPSCPHSSAKLGGATVGAAKIKAKHGPALIGIVLNATSKETVADGNKTAAPDSLSGLKPVFDDTSWQKGLAKTWRDTFVEIGVKPLMLGGAEIAMLKKALVFVPPKEKLEALAFFIRHWSKFRSFASSKFAIFEKTIPAVPTPQKLAHYRSYTHAFWEARAEVVGKAAASGAPVKKDYMTMDEGMALLAKIKGEKK